MAWGWRRRTRREKVVSLLVLAGLTAFVGVVYEELSVEVVRARRVRVGRPATITIRPPGPVAEARVAPRLSGRTMHR